MKNSIERSIMLKCDTCGTDDKFKSSEDKSYVKCINCGREYFGGYEELKEYNQEHIHQQIEQMKPEVTDYVQKQLSDRLKKAFTGNKFIKIK